MYIVYCVYTPYDITIRWNRRLARWEIGIQLSIDDRYEPRRARGCVSPAGTTLSCPASLVFHSMDIFLELIRQYVKYWYQL